MNYVEILEIKNKYSKLRAEFINNKESFEKNYFSFWPLRARKVIHKCLSLKSDYQNLIFQTKILLEKLEQEASTEDYELKNLYIVIEDCNNGINSLNQYLSILSFHSSYSNSLFAVIVAIISLLIAIFSLLDAKHSDTQILNNAVSPKASVNSTTDTLEQTIHSTK